MDTEAIKKLINLATNYYELTRLSQEEKEWLFPLLSKGVLSTIELLSLIVDNRLTYEEISHLTGYSEMTISQKLNALEKGGYPLDLTGRAAIASTGRPRTLARKGENR